MVRGDTKGNTIMMGEHEVVLGFLKNVTIDQHVLRRNRQFDVIEVIEKHPELLGLHFDENTAIVVRGDTFEVIGPSYVLVYDNERTPVSRLRAAVATSEPSRHVNPHPLDSGL